MKILMSREIQNIINAVIDYGRYLYSHYLIVKDPEADVIGKMKEYYFSLPLPGAMYRNNADFERILCWGWYDGSRLEALNAMSYAEMDAVVWKDLWE